MRLRRRLTRALFAAAVAVALLAATSPGRGAHSRENAKTATPADALVLGRLDVPGLRPVRTTPNAATTALERALSPADIAPPAGVQRSASRFVGPGAELWSIALVYGNRESAARELKKLLRAARAARIGSIAAPVGEPGHLLRPGRSAVVVWRRGPALGTILLTRPAIGRRALGRLALAYARLGDAHLAQTVAASAWDRALSRISTTGRRPRRAALELFALAYAPLPGTRRPAGPSGRPEGTVAARDVLRIWRTLNTAQRRAALRALGLTGVSLRARAASMDGLRGGSIYGDDQFVLNVEYQRIADGFRAAYEQRLGTTFSHKLVVGTSPGARNGFADTLPVEEGGILSILIKTTVCRIRIGPGAQGPRLRFALAHEVFHCAQISLMGPARWLNARDWLTEGTADWAAFSLVPDFNGSSSIRDYLQSCRAPPLFQRTYSAVGFFGHVEDSTGPLWPRVGPVLRAPDDLSSYAAAGGANAGMLDSWGSSVAVEPGFGLNWTVQSPVAPPGGNRCAATPLAPGAVAAEPFTLQLYDVSTVGANAQRPILHLTIKGHARISDGAVDMAGLSDDYFCLVGDCKCPPDREGNPPPAPKLGSPAYLGLAGGRVGTQGQAELEPLEKYCKKKKKDPPRPPASPPVGGGGPSGGGSPNSGCSSGCGGSNGDPHLTTFDGRFYDHQAAGEFILATADGLEVQVREEPYPGSNNLSINSAVAMRVGRDRVAVYRGRPLPVRVNGSGFVPSRRYTKLPRGGGWIRSLADQVEVWWADGTVARVWPVEPWGVSVLVKPSERRRGALRGLLGNFDGNAENDFVTREGRNLPDTTPSNYRLLYRVLGESWRIRHSESLLDYARGQSTNTFTDRRFPAQIVTPANLPASDRAEAERACARLGIADPRILQACILDVAGTGDNGFATNAATLQRTGKSFRGAGGSTDQGVTRWAELASGGRSNSVTPSVALSEGKVVVAFSGDGTSAEAVTFTPSRPRDAVEIRRHLLVSGWALVDDPVLVERPGGGLQALIAGFHSTTTGDPLNATSILVRNPDGSFGPPVPVTTATDLGHAVQAPDGQPLWVSSATGGLYLWRGASAPANSDLSSLVGGTSYIPTLGRDGLGRYWLAWYVLSRQSQQTGIYLAQIDPGTLQPLGMPQQAPRSGTPDNSGVRITLACAATCRVAYLETTTSGLTSGRILTWAHGAGAPTVIARGRPDQWLAAAYTSAGRLWVVWFDEGAGQYRAVLGNASGAGGRPFAIGRAATAGRGFALTAISVGSDLVVVTNWARGSVYSRFVNVVAPPGG